MSKKTATLEIDQKESVYIAAQILDAMDGQPVEKTSTILNGLAVAMMTIAKDAAKHQTQKGMVEKMILHWFAACDSINETQFSKYINLGEDEAYSNRK